MLGFFVAEHRSIPKLLCIYRIVIRNYYVF
jgi:hypothetical protein